jgi:hypothetical protein
MQDHPGKKYQRLARHFSTLSGHLIQAKLSMNFLASMAKKT